MSPNKKLSKYILKELGNISDDNVVDVTKSDERLLSVSYQLLIRQIINRANELATLDHSMEIFPRHIETALTELIEK